MIIPYLRTKDVFLCPSNPIGWGERSMYWENKPGGNGDETEWYPVSYGTNSLLVTFYDPEKDPEGVLPTPDLSNVPEPSDTLLVLETKWLSRMYPDFSAFDVFVQGHGKSAAFHHNKRINCLFVDGHVKALTAIQTFLPKPLWGSKAALTGPVNAGSGIPYDDTEIPTLVRNIAAEYR